MKVALAGQGAFGVRHLEAMQNIPVFPPFASSWQCTSFWASRLDHRDAMSRRRVGRSSNVRPTTAANSARLLTRASGVV